MTAAVRSPRLGGGVVLALLAGALGLVAGLDPKLAIAAAFGAAFVLVVFADLGAGLALFTLFAFMDSLPGLDAAALGLTKVLGLLLALSWLATISTRRDSGGDFFAHHPAIGYALVLFLAWSLASQLWAESGPEALESSYRYLLNLALFPIVFTAVRGRREAVWIVAAFAVGASASALYGLVVPPEESGELGRLAGTIGDPNQLAAILIAGAVLSGGLAGALRPQSMGRLLAAGAALLCLLATLLTLSRGGLVALAVVLVAAALLAGRWRPHAAALGVVAVLGAVAYFGLLAPQEARERVLATEGGSGRVDIWTVGWRMVEAEPIRGVGSGNFEVSSVHYLLEPGVLRRDEFIVDTPKVAHSVYLEILAELGAVGVALFIAIVLGALGCALAAARRFGENDDPSMELLARSAAVAVLGILAADFFISDQFSKQLWLLLALGPALLALARTPVETGGAPR